VSNLATAQGSLVNFSERSLGQSVADGIIGSIEADIDLSIHIKSVREAYERLKRIKKTIIDMIASVCKGADHDEAEMARLYVEGCRPRLLSCFLAVNSEMATTSEGRQRISTLVDHLIETYLAKIETPIEKKKKK
jgi:hypothetical protein